MPSSTDLARYECQDRPEARYDTDRSRLAASPPFLRDLTTCIVPVLERRESCYDSRRRTIVFGDDADGNIRSAVIDDQVPCSGCVGQRVRLETEQPNRFTQVPWSTWSSMTADRLAEDVWRWWTVRTARRFGAVVVFSQGSRGAIDGLRVS